MPVHFHDFAVRSSSVYQQWKDENVPLDSPRKVLTAARTVLADMKISNVTAVKCQGYFAAHGYALKIETIRRWYRKNCRTVEEAHAIIRGAEQFVPSLEVRRFPNSPVIAGKEPAEIGLQQSKRRDLMDRALADMQEKDPDVINARLTAHMAAASALK